MIKMRNTKTVQPTERLKLPEKELSLPRLNLSERELSQEQIQTLVDQLSDPSEDIRRFARLRLKDRPEAAESIVKLFAETQSPETRALAVEILKSLYPAEVVMGIEAYAERKKAGSPDKPIFSSILIHEAARGRRHEVDLGSLVGNPRLARNPELLRAAMVRAIREADLPDLTMVFKDKTLFKDPTFKALIQSALDHGLITDKRHIDLLKEHGIVPTPR